MDFVHLFQLVDVLLFAVVLCVGCDNEKKFEGDLASTKAEAALSSQEAEVKGALVGLLVDTINAKTVKDESSSTADFVRVGVLLLHSSPSNLNQRAILSQLRKDVLAMEIFRPESEKPMGKTQRSSMNRFIDAAYLVSDLSSSLQNNTPDFEHLVFDMEVCRRMLREIDTTSKSGVGRAGGASGLISGWEWHSFYSPESDFRRYWRHASPEDRRSALQWFRKLKGQVPDWVD